MLNVCGTGNLHVNGETTFFSLMSRRCSSHLTDVLPKTLLVKIPGVRFFVTTHQSVTTNSHCHEHLSHSLTVRNENTEVGKTQFIRTRTIQTVDTPYYCSTCSVIIHTTTPKP